MKKNIPGLFSFQQLWGCPALIFLTALFLCGAIAGGAAGHLAADSNPQLITQLSVALGAQVEPDAIDGLYAALGALGWQAAALLAGWARPASLFLSLAAMARGFALSFSVSALSGTLGIDGIWQSFAASGAAAVIKVPCLLLTAAACFTAAQQAPHGHKNGYFYALGRYRGVLLLCTLGAMWAAALQVPVGWAVGHWLLGKG